jgi:hypothetical protein
MLTLLLLLPDACPQDDATDSRPKTMVGTPAYVAPEVRTCGGPGPGAQRAQLLRRGFCLTMQRSQEPERAGASCEVSICV